MNNILIRKKNDYGKAAENLNAVKSKVKINVK